ncbi:MAG: hypothetical protein ACI9DF_001552 [Verrucomicrobiales bacterium]|jgi:hypothetical protein
MRKEFEALPRECQAHRSLSGSYSVMEHDSGKTGEATPKGPLLTSRRYYCIRKDLPKVTESYDAHFFEFGYRRGTNNPGAYRTYQPDSILVELFYEEPNPSNPGVILSHTFVDPDIDEPFSRLDPLVRDEWMSDKVVVNLRAYQQIQSDIE